MLQRKHKDIYSDYALSSSYRNRTFFSFFIISYDGYSYVSRRLGHGT